MSTDDAKQKRASVNMGKTQKLTKQEKVHLKEEKERKKREQKCFQKIQALDKASGTARNLMENYLALYKKYPQEIDLYLQHQYGVPAKSPEIVVKPKQELGRDGLPPVIMDTTWKTHDANTAVKGHQAFPVKAVWYPTTVAQVQAVVVEAEKNGAKVRVAGSGASPLGSSLTLPSNTSYIIDVQGLNKLPPEGELFFTPAQKALIRDEVLSPPPSSTPSKSKAPAVVPLIFFQVEGGALITDINVALDARNLALTTQPAWDNVTIAGAVSTGSHGTGRFLGSISDYVVSFEIVGSGGKLYRVEPSNGITDPAKFAKACGSECTLIQDTSTFHSLGISLGSCGVITSLILNIEKQYWLKETCEATSWGNICKLLKKGAFNFKRQKDRSQLYINPYPVGNSTNTADYFAVGFFRKYTTKQPSSVTTDEKRRYFSTVIFPRLTATPTSTANQQQPAQEQISSVEYSEAAAVVASAVRVFPDHTPDLIDLVLKGVVDRAYTNISHKVLTYHLNDISSESSCSVEIAFPIGDVDKFIASMELIFQYIKEMAEQGNYLTLPLCLRFVDESKHVLSPSNNGAVCYIEFSCISGTRNGIPLLQYLQHEVVKMGGVPHWANRILPVPIEKVKEFYPSFDDWTKTFSKFNGQKYTFSNALTDELYGQRSTAPPAFNFQKSSTHISNSSGNSSLNNSSSNLNGSNSASGSSNGSQPSNPSASGSGLPSYQEAVDQPQQTPQPAQPQPQQTPPAAQQHPQAGELQRQMTLGPFNPPVYLADNNKTELKKYNPKEVVREYPHIAKGSFGLVFKGKVPGVDALVAIKDMEVTDERSVQDWKKEIATMNQNRCPYVVNVYGYTADRNILTIVMEFMSKGDLFNLLHKKLDVPLSMLQRLRMSRHAALSVAFLHQNHIMHRDIKSMNFLVTDDYSCKLTDFGCAKLTSDRQMFNTLNTGTPLWMAPEVKKGQYNFSADIYSLGLVLYELFERRLPGFDQNLMAPVLPSQFQSSAVVLPCVNLTPEKRPTAAKVVSLLDTMIQNIVKLVRDVLPKAEQEKLHKEAKNVLEEADVAGDATKRDVLEMEFTQLYNHLLNKPPQEVDQLIAKAFSSAKKG